MGIHDRDYMKRPPDGEMSRAELERITQRAKRNFVKVLAVAGTVLAALVIVCAIIASQMND